VKLGNSFWCPEELGEKFIKTVPQIADFGKLFLSPLGTT